MTDYPDFVTSDAAKFSWDRQSCRFSYPDDPVLVVAKVISLVYTDEFPPSGPNRKDLGLIASSAVRHLEVLLDEARETRPDFDGVIAEIRRTVAALLGDGMDDESLGIHELIKLLYQTARRRGADGQCEELAPQFNELARHYADLARRFAEGETPNEVSAMERQWRDLMGERLERRVADDEDPRRLLNEVVGKAVDDQYKNGWNIACQEIADAFRDAGEVYASDEAADEVMDHTMLTIQVRTPRRNRQEDDNA